MATKDRQLLIVNYCLDLNDPILSHQASTVLALAEHYKQITVLTGRIGKFDSPENVHVINLNWAAGSNFRNGFNVLRFGLKNLLLSRPDAVFTHMADVHAAILAPWIRLLRVKHVLWYAHAYKSAYLKFSSRFVNILVSSTPGSMPLDSKKVRLIGQSIDTTLFKPENRVLDPKGRYLHVGRLDSSKQIDLICETYLSQHGNNDYSDLSFIGSASNPKSDAYRVHLFSKYQNEITTGKIRFLEPVPRASLPKIYGQYDVFIHAFVGSLDKTLLEATAVGLPVVTINPEYNSEFGTWSRVDSERATLAGELSSFLEKSLQEMTNEAHRRTSLVKQSHSQNRWIVALLVILQT